MWERPRLRRHVLDLANCDSGLFAHFTADAGFEIFARLNESGQRGIELVGVALVMSKQTPVSVRDQDDDGGVGARIKILSAGPTCAAPSRIADTGVAAAASTAFGCRVPGGKRSGHAGQRQVLW